MMPEKKLWEYHVSDVSEKFDYASLKQVPEEKFQIDKLRKIPTVVIFGWAGSIDKYLKVYSKLYEERGLRTIRYIVPAKYQFFESNSMLKIGEEMVDVWVKQSFKDSPIVLHALSNGGAFQYEVFMRALKQTPHLSQVKGMIFDSCPSKRNLFSLYKALENNVESKHLKMPKTAALTLYVRLKWYLEKSYAQVMQKESIYMNPYQTLMNETFRWPQHFIHSTSDKIMLYESIDAFADYRRTLGVDVTVKRYDNSQHVQHYLKNKASYVRSVVRFVNKCLKR